MNIKLSKKMLEAALIFQAKNDVRFYLNGILFKNDGRVISTNGHVAFIGESHQSAMKNDIIMSVPKSPTSKYDYAEIIVNENKVNYYLDDKVVAISLTHQIDGKFPDIDRVIPESAKPTDKIGFNAGYLYFMYKAAKIFNPSFQLVALMLNGENGAATAEISSPDEKAKIVLMPARL